MKRYINIKEHSTIKVETTKEEGVFYVVVTSMGEEIQMRLDKQGFFKNGMTQINRVAMAKEIEELKNGEFAIAEGETRSAEQTEELRERQEEMEKRYSERIDYIVDGLNAIELYDYYSNLGLSDELVGLSSIDETIKNNKVMEEV